MRFEHKVAVITGGNSGIGKSIATRFVEEGAKVAIIGRNQETLDATKKELGESCTSYQTDVSKPLELEKTFKEISDHLGAIDILILNAGHSEHHATKDVTEEAFDRNFNTNVKGPFFTFQKALPYLKEGSSIVAISSISSLLGITSMGVYAASKAALNRIMIAFSAEFLETKKMRFNIVSPGYTNTPIFDELTKQDEKFIENSIKPIPMKRMADPVEIANSVLFLASDEAKYISGTNLVVDGGLSSTFPLTKLQQM